MAGSMSVLGRQLGSIWQHFGVNQKVSIVLALVATIALIGGLLTWSARPDYRLLYSGLSLEDAAAARERIEDEKIPVQLRDSGRSIYVPAKDVYRCRLLLAAEGLPKDSSTGFELFEQPKFGLTDFAQRINYQRALQGELERTINAMSGIRSCRVTLVLPQRSLFATEAEKMAKASIMLTIADGDSLSAAQVRSIQQLVAGSVEGLTSSAIAVTDQNGRMLAKGAASEEGLEAASDQWEIQVKLEDLLERKAQEMLDIALGAGRSLVRVSATLDFSRVEKRKETYDPDGRVVIGETISSETSSEPGMASGGGSAPFVQVPVGDPGRMTVEQPMSKRKREDIDTRYKVPSGQEHVVQQGARIQRLSVAVSVAAGAEPRDAATLTSIANMVKNAVGFVEAAPRADSIEVVEMPFTTVAADPVSAPSWWQAPPAFAFTLARGLGALLILLIVYLFSRRVMASLMVERTELGTPVGSLAAGGDEEIGGLLSVDGMQIEPTFDGVARLAEENPRAIAAWITNVSKGAR
jgi:flagellar M-ring protein FliF